MLQGKTVDAKNHRKNFIDYSTRLSATSFAIGLVTCISNGMHQLGSCGCRAVGLICHKDVKEIKNDIIAVGTK